MYSTFAWRYFKAKKSANAINIIAWVTTGVIALATFCQVLVLSVFNGFEDLVKSLYSSFYTDLKIVPPAGKTFIFTAAQLKQLQQQPYISAVSMVAEDKAILQNGEAQTFLTVKGVDDNFEKVSGVPGKISNGEFNVGTIDNPGLVVGYGIQNAAGISFNPAIPNEHLTVTLPKKNVTSMDPLQSLSEGNVSANGVFIIQQDFDNNYAITNIGFIKQQMGFAADEYSAAEIKLKEGSDINKTRLLVQQLLGNKYLVQTRYQQNSNLYSTMRLEKWAIYGVLTLIIIIAAFNIVSALTMLVLEKQKDISILQSIGSSRWGIQKIFLSEGLLLGLLGAIAGIALATIVCLLQLKFKLIKLQGGSFLIDYFPVKLIASDFLLVGGTALAITFIASWFPSFKASRQPIELK
ncbi:FtsX-like permease family protein [Ferruginibacter sp. HRS2-29]|uniref:FtsX-like permease family protein n=1 Tax=Ferruginibacter sp. HRS2-29 TaxID=2487334 RepID=UPI0020CCEA6B|nr:FtsX-like permease family protein [Ferruginibacter sp. HRS2-29]MCP9752175.1 FtsX-like permease family protein [Ferruginibacter sp. HRS2-29]